MRYHFYKSFETTPGRHVMAGLLTVLGRVSRNAELVEPLPVSGKFVSRAEHAVNEGSIYREDGSCRNRGEAMT